MNELYPLLEGYTNMCRMKNIRMACIVLMAGTWLNANRYTGNRKKEK
jgi:hypothetical protein